MILGNESDASSGPFAWDRYLCHRDLKCLEEDLLTDPWHVPATDAAVSLLMKAIRRRDVAAVRLLISLGEDPRLPAADGFTLLHEAVDMLPNDPTSEEHAASLEVLTALLKVGAEPNIQGVDGTPLHRAAGSGGVAAARVLIAFGADLEARRRVDGELTPLMHAALMGQPAMVRALLDAGADRSAVSGASMTDAPNSNLKQLLSRWDVRHKDEILKLLDERT